MARTRSLNVGATIALGLLAAMCGERPGAKVRVQPLKAAAGKTGGSAAAAGRGTTGSTGGAGGTANGQVGASGEPGAGEGGASMQMPDDNGTMNRGGTSSRGGGAGRTSAGGAGAIDGSGDTGATDASGGTAGEDATAATGGRDDTGSAGDTGEPGTGGVATGGSAGQSLGGGGAGGSGGATTSCELKTGCCSVGDPPCIDGCPLDADFCCDMSMGARIQCNPAISYTAVVCLDCAGQSFGTQPCSTSCLVTTDPACSDAAWDDICSTGGSAHCSDATAGYRAGCYSADGGSQFHSYISCTCDPDS